MATARAIRKAYASRYASLDLSLSQASLIAFLDESGPRSQTHLARCLGMGRAAAGLVIDALARRDLVERRPNPEDRRAWLIALRPEGQALVEPILEIDLVLRRALRSGIRRDERQQLAGLLIRLQANLSEVLEADEER